MWVGSGRSCSPLCHRILGLGPGFFYILRMEVHLCKYGFASFFPVVIVVPFPIVHFNVEAPQNKKGIKFRV